VSLGRGGKYDPLAGNRTPVVHSLVRW